MRIASGRQTSITREPLGSGGKEIAGRVGGDRPREPESLAVRTRHLAQPLGLLGGLDSLGHDADTEVVGQSENGLDDGSRV